MPRPKPPKAKVDAWLRTDKGRAWLKNKRMESFHAAVAKVDAQEEERLAEAPRNWSHSKVARAAAARPLPAVRPEAIRHAAKHWHEWEERLSSTLERHKETLG